MDSPVLCLHSKGTTFGGYFRRKVGIRQVEQQVNINVAVSTHKGCHGEGSPALKYFGDDFPVNGWTDSKFPIEV